MYCEDSGSLKLRELNRLVWEAAAAMATAGGVSAEGARYGDLCRGAAAQTGRAL
jgi:hypothetical protein